MYIFNKTAQRGLNMAIRPVILFNGYRVPDDCAQIFRLYVIHVTMRTNRNGWTNRELKKIERERERKFSS